MAERLTDLNRVRRGVHSLQEGDRIIAYVEGLERDNARLAAELAGAPEALRSLERMPFEGHPEWLYCGVCRMWMSAHPQAGHAEDCALVPLLARLGSEA